ncbi:hypothetical protein OG785_34965 [Streptomyces sp. NBC_00006]|uniref:hypothetical protein n=1 Tax=unclassified Streptomyces TaxID=2593676 RepID=UPI0022525389|nr:MULTISPECIES: hypothetical protein [unclassified Streptomyces]MCX5535745.1 hypothetical protein [Streptomyces sp. NBC_00006]
MARLDTLASLLSTRFDDLRHQIKERGDAGYTTETIIVTALLAILGLTVVGIIVAKVTAKANGIDLGS